MAAGLLLQYLVIALAVALSAGYVFKRQWPGTVCAGCASPARCRCCATGGPLGCAS